MISLTKANFSGRVNFEERGHSWEKAGIGAVCCLSQQQQCGSSSSIVHSEVNMKQESVIPVDLGAWWQLDVAVYLSQISKCICLKL